MAKLKWTVEFEVDASWVADGFNLTDERARDMLSNEIPYARPDELCAKVVRMPRPETILREQGYDPDRMSEVEKTKALS